MSPDFFRENRERLIAEVDENKPALLNATSKALRAMAEAGDGQMVNVRGRKRTLTYALHNAHRRGSDRDPVRHDVLVHPHWPWHEKIHKKMQEKIDMISPDFIPDTVLARALHVWRGRYFKALEALLSTGNIDLEIEHLPIPRTAPILNDRLLQKISVEPDIERGVSGFLDPQEFVRSTEILNGFHADDDLYVHGASYANCVRSFLHQQICARYLGVYYPDDDFFGSSSYENWKQRSSLIENALAASWIFRECKMRIGLAFDVSLNLPRCQRFIPQTPKHPACIGAKVIPGSFKQLKKDIDSAQAILNTHAADQYPLYRQTEDEMGEECM